MQSVALYSLIIDSILTTSGTKLFFKNVNRWTIRSLYICFFYIIELSFEKVACSYEEGMLWF